jgi:hypothetical protein
MNLTDTLATTTNQELEDEVSAYEPHKKSDMAHVSKRERKVGGHDRVLVADLTYDD